MATTPPGAHLPSALANPQTRWHAVQTTYSIAYSRCGNSKPLRQLRGSGAKEPQKMPRERRVRPPWKANAGNWHSREPQRNRGCDEGPVNAALNHAGCRLPTPFVRSCCCAHRHTVLNIQAAWPRVKPQWTSPHGELGSRPWPCAQVVMRGTSYSGHRMCVRIAGAGREATRIQTPNEVCASKEKWHKRSGRQ